MPSILVPIDGSESALRAVEHVIRLALHMDSIDVRLLNVQTPLASASGWILSRVERKDVHRKQWATGMRLLQPAQALLDAAEIRCEARIVFGEPASRIVSEAAHHRVAMIVMGAQGMTPIVDLLIGSVARKVLHLAAVPVTLIR